MLLYHFFLLTGFCLFLVVAPVCAITSSVFLTKQDNKSCANWGGYSFILYLPYFILVNIISAELFITFLLLLLFTVPHCVNLHIANKSQSKNLKYGAIFGIISSLSATIGFFIFLYGIGISGV